MNARTAIALVALAACSAWVFACAQDTVVLASIPPDDGGGPPQTPPTRCAQNPDCGDTAYCVKATCDAEFGTCTSYPTVCQSDPVPVCGCDHVTYFNDCLRQGAGIAASTPQECDQGALECAGPDHKTCPSGTFCAQILGPVQPHACPPDAPGKCWSLPAKCPSPPAPTDTDRFIPCDTQGPPPPDSVCADTCNAIRSDAGPYYRANFCP